MFTELNLKQKTTVKIKLCCNFFLCFREPTAADVSGRQTTGLVFKF